MQYSKLAFDQSLSVSAQRMISSPVDNRRAFLLFLQCIHSAHKTLQHLFIFFCCEIMILKWFTL